MNSVMSPRTHILGILAAMAVMVASHTDSRGAIVGSDFTGPFSHSLWTAVTNGQSTFDNSSSGILIFDQILVTSENPVSLQLTSPSGVAGEYQFSMDWGFAFTSVTPKDLTVNINGISTGGGIVNVTQSGGIPGGQITATLNPPSSFIEFFIDLETGPNSQMQEGRLFFTNFQYAIVPEPSTCSLLAGLAGLAVAVSLYSRRKAKDAQKKPSTSPQR